MRVQPLIGTLIQQGTDPIARLFLPFTGEAYLFGPKNVEIREDHGGSWVHIGLKREDVDDDPHPPTLAIGHSTPDTTCAVIRDGSGLCYSLNDFERHTVLQLLKGLGETPGIQLASELLGKANDPSFSTPEPENDMLQRFDWVFAAAASAYTLSYVCDKIGAVRPSEVPPGPRAIYFTGTRPGYLDRIIVASATQKRLGFFAHRLGLFTRKDLIILKREDYPHFFGAVEAMGGALDTTATRFGLVWVSSTRNYLNFPGDLQKMVLSPGPFPVSPPFLPQNLMTSGRQVNPTFVETEIAEAVHELHMTASIDLANVGLLNGVFNLSLGGPLREGLMDLRDLYATAFPVRLKGE